MKTKTPASAKKQTVTVRDLKTRKNPKGGQMVNTTRSNIRHPSSSITDSTTTSVMQDVSTTR